MKVNLPEFMMRHLPASSGFYLIVGTYGSVARSQLGQAGNSITKIGLRFRSYPGQDYSFDGIQENPVGTMDPGAFQTSDNRLVLGLVETPHAGLAAVTMWVPDGAGGQYTVEQAYFFLEQWLVSKAQKNMQLGQIVGGVAVGTAIAMLAPGPIGGFLAGKFMKGPFLKKIQEQDRNYDRLDLITTPRLMRDFGHWLMENNYFVRAFEQGAPQAQSGRTGRL